MTKTVNCIKLGREAEALDFPPLPGPLGQRVFENVSKEAWQQWVKLQTMIINENRLNLADARARQLRFTATGLAWLEAYRAGVAQAELELRQARRVAEIEALAGSSDLMSATATLSQLGDAQARALLAEFLRGRWRARIHSR